MTAGLSVRPIPAACRISTASPILLHPNLITVFSGGTNTGEPWEQFSVDQSIKSGRNGSGTKHLVFIAGHPSKYWPRTLALNQSTVPVLQPPLHLSSLFLERLDFLLEHLDCRKDALNYNSISFYIHNKLSKHVFFLNVKIIADLFENDICTWFPHLLKNHWNSDIFEDHGRIIRVS